MLKVLELFGGIGACTKALKKLNIDYEIVDYVEIDKYAVTSYNAINGTNFEPQDITKWNKDIDVDLIMHGLPCQDFSQNGRQAGGDENSGTRSSLMYETIKIVEKLKPKYVIWENVKNILSKKHKHNFDNYLLKMNNLGYNNFFQVLNAKDYGIPQNRERVFTVSIRKDLNQFFFFPKEQELKLCLNDMLEKDVDYKYFVSAEMINGMIKTHFNTYKLENRLQDKDGLCKTILTSCSSRCPLLIKTNNNKGYDELNDGGSLNISFPNSKTRRGRVGKQISQTIETSNNICVKNTENYIEWKEKGKLDIDCRAFKSDKISGTIMTTPKNKVINEYGIRRLTPLETWKLMGFDRQDFMKASQFVSETQLYKQAGNSIVVNCLYEIFKNLLKGENYDNN